MNAQSIVGWLAIFVALGIGIWQWTLYGRGQVLPVLRVVVGALSATVLYYAVIWFLWTMIMILEIFAAPWITEAHIAWLFDSLMSPWRWLAGLFR